MRKGKPDISFLFSHIFSVYFVVEVCYCINNSSSNNNNNNNNIYFIKFMFQFRSKPLSPLLLLLLD